MNRIAKKLRKLMFWIQICSVNRSLEIVTMYMVNILAVMDRELNNMQDCDIFEGCDTI